MFIDREIAQAERTKTGREDAKEMFNASLRAVISAALAMLVLPQTAIRAQRAETVPEIGSGRSDHGLRMARSFMVSAANPLAVAAGVEILRAGGSAADAAVAVQLVLNVVEPQSSGLGGGAYALHWTKASAELEGYDGRETAPAAASPDRFIRGGKPMPFDSAVHSGLSIGVPGTPRLLEAIHRAHGRLPWPRLFEPALRLATGGFPVSPRLNRILREMGADGFDPVARAYFFDAAGVPRPVGYPLVSPRLAETLMALRDGGADAFYKGAVATAISAAAATAPTAGAEITAAELGDYKVEVRAPVCAAYRRHRVCGMGPSSSGGLAIGQALMLLGHFDLGHGEGAALAPEAVHLIAEALKLAFADRNRYVGDPDFVKVPWGMLDPVYLDIRSRLMSTGTVMPPPQAGKPPGVDAKLHGRDDTRESVGTSHFSIVDRDGNAVAMTTTIEAAFGARIMAAGFLLNNEVTDFSFLPTDRDGRAIANAVAPGKRPRSSMAPTMIFDPEGRLMAVLGSPGGSRIIQYVLKAVVALIDWNLDAERAAALVNFGSRGREFEIESDPALPTAALIDAMRARGHQVVTDEMTSGLHIVRIRGDGLEGGADPRREGTSDGD